MNDSKKSIIHIFNYNYIVDGKTFVEEPIGVYADLLTHEITFISAPKNNLKNINQVFTDCDIEIERLISRTFALGVKLISEKELEFGSTILDLGSEKISFGIFKNLALVHSITFPIGINHITKDISKVCSLNLNESENIRNNIDFLFKDNQKIFDESDCLKKIYFIDSSFRKISKNLILSVVKARLDEIFDILKKQLIVPGFNLTSRINLLLVGGGSNLLNIEKCFINFFGSNVKKVDKKSLQKDSDLKENFDSCLGAFEIIKDGWETEAIPGTVNQNIEKISFFAKIFKVNR